MQEGRSEVAAKRASEKTKSPRVFGHAQKPAKMFRAGIYARVSTDDQKTIPLQLRALREYAGRRGWTIALQMKEVGSGASERQQREKLLEAARRREIDVVLVWRLDRWGRSVADLLATLQELEYLGVGFVSLTEALDLTTPAGRAMAAPPGGLRRVRTRDSARTGARRFGTCPPERPAPGSTADRGASRRPRTEAVPCRRQQGRDRSPVADRPHLGSPYSGLTYFREK